MYNKTCQVRPGLQVRQDVEAHLTGLVHRYIRANPLAPAGGFFCPPTLKLQRHADDGYKIKKPSRCNRDGPFYYK
ncbi:hypothetical protein A4D02_05545 [Niastella koreensis]|uniref:Uncharacterized protein n=1 Tax=Niastella koreensis TaxID=354356 RepID=A0ABX3NV98_9BACT|nr:hypothetical protein A4D02_05545 [Niastella koreensis]